MLKKSLKLFSATVFATVAIVCLSSFVESGEGSSDDGDRGEEKSYYVAIECPNNGGTIEIKGKCCEDGQWMCSYVSCVNYKAPSVTCPN